MADLTVSQGDYGFTLTFTVQTASGAAFNLTSKTTYFKVWYPGRTGTLIVNGTASSSSPTTGVAVYTVASTDFLAKGLYHCELEMTEATKADSTQVYTLEVTESP